MRVLNFLQDTKAENLKFQQGLKEVLAALPDGLAVVMSGRRRSAPRADSSATIGARTQMAKVTWRKSSPSSPIYSEGSEVFVPMSKPSMSDSLLDTGGPLPPDEEERLATEWNSLRLERFRRLQERLSSEGSLAPAPPPAPTSSPSVSGSDHGDDSVAPL